MNTTDRTDPSMRDTMTTEPVRENIRTEPLRDTIRTDPSVHATDRTDPTVRETTRLIASDKVEGTAVRDSAGNKVGTIERVMIDKRSGKVAYAVMSFGGFLGIGSDYVSLPWHVLRYSEDLDAYELNVTEAQLRGAPPLSGGWETGTVSREWERNIHNYYGVDPYW